MYLQDLILDVRYGCRAFARSPGFAATVILTLALGIGANTAVFSIVDGVLLKPPPYRDPSRLVAVWDHSNRESGLAKIFASYGDLQQYAKHAKTLEHVGAATWAVGSKVMTGAGQAQSVLAIPVSDSLFRTLGVAAALGRTFGPDDGKLGCAAVLSHSFWETRLGGKRNVVGWVIGLDGKPCTVIGVMPAGFAFYPKAAMMWTVLDANTPGDLPVGIFARLKAGVTREQAREELEALHTALHRADVFEKDVGPMVYSLQDEFTWMAGRNLRTTLFVLLGAVGLVLLIACANVMNLVLGRGLSRRREIAVRAALGSGRGRLVRQLVAEGLVLAVAGGIAGMFVAVWAVQWFNATAPIELPVGADVRVNGTVLAASVVLSIMTALLFSLVPAWRVSNVDVNDSLKSGSRAVTTGIGRSLPTVLIAAEVALSVVLLTGAGLLMESVVRFGLAPVGFQPDGVVSARIMLPRDRYADGSRRTLLFAELQRRIGLIRGVTEVAVASSLPPQGAGNASIEIAGRPVTTGMEQHDVGRAAVTPNYFSVLRVPLLRGRVFGAEDSAASEPVAIVNEAFAREYFPGGDAVGQRIRSDYAHEITPWMRIVGVVGTEKKATVYQEMALANAPMVFRPEAQDPPRTASLAIRVGSMREAFGEDAQRAISAVDPEIPAGEIRTLRGEFGAILAYPRFRAVVLAGFAGLALLLAAVGVLGVLHQFVAQRKREIGVRVAVGAQRVDVLRLVSVQAGVPVFAGLFCGIAGAVGLSRFVANLLYDVKPRDPSMLVGVAAVLLVTAGIATVVPARRAMSVDPITVLRDE